MASQPLPLFVSRLELVNIKCFAKALMEFDHDADMPWSVVVGDNSTGKSVLARSLALGLCDQTSAAGLLRESDEGYIRSNERSGSIVVDLCERGGGGQKYRIKTCLTRVDEGRATFERLTQDTEPQEGFPWNRIFACAYGTGRAISGTGDIAGYSVINAVYNLFSYGEGLQNPELNLLRLKDPLVAARWLGWLAQVLPVNEAGIHLAHRGLTFDGAWGANMPFRDLADGIRGTFLWTADLIGWAIAFDKNVRDPSAILGVVIIDELEQHLHATWQRDVVSRMRVLFPGIQFIATTHSPFIAASVGNLGRPNSRDKLFFCELDGETRTVTLAEHEFVQTFRIEQVLASRAFKYLIEASSKELEDVLQRASELVDKGTRRSVQEEDEYQQLKAVLTRATFLRADSSGQRAVEEEELARAKEIIQAFERSDTNS